MDAARDPELEPVSGSSALHPGLVGQRVVVRSRVPGEAGPTGGPLFTDVLGILEAWSHGLLTIRTATDELVEVAVDLVVSGKAVPPRPERRRRSEPPVEI